MAVMSWCMVFLAILASFSAAQTNGYCNLLWNDEFDGTAVDTSKWQKEVNCHGGGNNELQCYTSRPKNVFIEDGKLVLRVFKEQYTGTQEGCTDYQGCTNTKGFTSGRLRSALAPGGSFLRGRMEIRAKLASGSHLWPAIWMLPTDWNYGGWAASGEIDIMEQRGNRPSEVAGTLHHGGTWPNNRWTSRDVTLPFDLSLDYHVYAFEWTETQMKWYVDSNNFHTLNLDKWWNTTVSNNPYTAKGQPWDKKFHFVLNVAVGGGYFGGYPALTDADVAQWKVPEMRVDYVRAWALGGDCSQISAPSSGPITSNPTIRPPISASNVVEAPSAVDNAMESGEDMQAAVKTTVIVSAVVGGTMFLLGAAGIVFGVILIRRAQRNLSVNTTPVTPSSSQTHLTQW